jgi:hypothetical protein
MMNTLSYDGEDDIPAGQCPMQDNSTAHVIVPIPPETTISGTTMITGTYLQTALMTELLQAPDVASNKSIEHVSVTNSRSDIAIVLNPTNDEEDASYVSIENIASSTFCDAESAAVQTNVDFIHFDDPLSNVIRDEETRDNNVGILHSPIVHVVNTLFSNSTPTAQPVSTMSRLHGHPQSVGMYNDDRMKIAIITPEQRAHHEYTLPLVDKLEKAFVIYLAPFSTTTV